MKTNCCDAARRELLLELGEIRTRLKLGCLLKRHWFVLVGIATLCGVALLQTQFSLIAVVGVSMVPTFETGDLLVVSKRAYRNREPKRGDIVIARHRDDLIVKRVVGLPGEEVQVKKGNLYVDDALLMENYEMSRGDLDIRKGKLLEGKFALLGDNRALASSQIVHAIVSKSQIVGKVVFSFRLRREKSVMDEGT